jgi:hypothetical protein
MTSAKAKHDDAHNEPDSTTVGLAASHHSSISRLHDGELSCVLPFLTLSDLARLMCCNRHFNAVVRKERIRELHLESDASIVPHPSSTLRHHVASLHLHSRLDTKVALTRDTLVSVAATMDGAQAKQRRSISRLHDDELSCVLPFLSLSELT